MGKGRGGRPKKESGDGETRQIRVFRDLADLIGEIIDVQPDVSVANLVDPWLRSHVLAAHARLKPQIDQLKKARADARKKSAGPGDG